MLERAIGACWYATTSTVIKLIFNLLAARRTYRTEWVEDLPDDVQRETVYIIGGRQHPFYAAVVCPRRACRQVIHLDLADEVERRWRLNEHEDGSISLTPSVHVTAMPCRCHYWFRRGRIRWVSVPRLVVPKENRCYAR